MESPVKKELADHHQLAVANLKTLEKLHNALEENARLKKELDDSKKNKETVWSPAIGEATPQERNIIEMLEAENQILRKRLDEFIASAGRARRELAETSAELNGMKAGRALALEEARSQIAERFEEKIESMVLSHEEERLKLQAELDQVLKMKAGFDEIIDGLRADLRNSGGTIEDFRSLKENGVSLSREIGELRNRLLESEKMISRLQGKSVDLKLLEDLRSRITELENLLSKERRKSQKLQLDHQAYNDIKRSLEEEKSEHEKTKAMVLGLQTRLEALDQLNPKGDIKSATELVEVNRINMELRRQVASLKDENRTLIIENSSKRALLKETVAERDSYRSQTEDLRQKLSALTNERIELISQLERLIKDKESWESDTRSKFAEFVYLQREVRKLKNQLAKEKLRSRQLEDAGFRTTETKASRPHKEDKKKPRLGLNQESDEELRQQAFEVVPSRGNTSHDTTAPRWMKNQHGIVNRPLSQVYRKSRY